MLQSLIFKADSYTNIQKEIECFLSKKNSSFKILFGKKEFIHHIHNTPVDLIICFGIEGFEIIKWLNNNLSDHFKYIYYCANETDLSQCDFSLVKNDNIIIEHLNQGNQFNTQNLRFLHNLIQKRKSSHLSEFTKFIPDFFENTYIGIWHLRRDEPISINLSPTEIIKKFRESRLKSCNKIFAKLFNQEVENIIDSSLDDLIKYIQIDEEVFLRMLEKPYVLKDEILNLKIGNNLKHLSFSIHLIVRNNIFIEAWGTITDITELMNLIDDQKMAYSNLFSFFQNPEFIGASYDLKGELLFFNDTYRDLSYSLTGNYPITGTDPVDLIQDKDLKTKIKELHRIVSTDKQVYDTFYIKQSDKSFRIYLNPIKKNGLLVGYTELFIDVTNSILTQNELLETNLKNQAILKSFPDIVFHLQKNGKIIDVKANNQDILLLSPKDLLSKHIYDLDMDKNLLDRIVSSINTTLETKEIHFLEYNLCINGTDRYFETRTVPAGNESVLFIIRDITERKETEIALIESERKLSTLIANIPGIVYRSDFDESWTKRYISQGCKELTGYEVEDFLHNSKISYNELIHPEDKAKVKFEIETAAEELDNFILSYRIITRSGKIKWVWEQGQFVRNEEDEIIGLEGVINDITQQIVATDELKLSQHNYKSTIDGLTEVVHVVDLNFNIVLCNESCKKWIYKLTKKTDIIGHNLFEMFPFFDDSIQEEYQFVIDKLKIIKSDEEQIVLGKKKSTETRKIPIFENGKLVKILTIVNDVTNTKHLDDIKNALYKISIITSSVKNIESLLISIQSTLGKITDTTNFYVALFDEKSKTFILPYESDNPDKGIIPTEKSLTSLVFNTGKPQLLREKDVIELEKKGIIETLGDRAKVWLGVPLKFGEKVMGVVAVQSYDNPDLYTNNDLQIFEFTSYEIARAIVVINTQQKVKDNLLEKEVMLQEIHHRVKNNLQIISSLLHIQSRNIDDEGSLSLLKESQNRVRSMAIIHQKLYEDKDLSKVDFNSYVRSLVAHLLSSYRITKANISFVNNIDNIFLSLKTAIPCGLVMNEIISNSLKYAFPDNRDGTIYVEMKQLGNKTFKLIIKDDGVGLSALNKETKSKSLGMELIDIFVHQIKGSYEIDTKKGVCYNIIFTDPYYND